MTTLNKVNGTYIQSVKSKNNELRDALKLLKAAFSNMEIEKKGQVLTDTDYITVINKLIKKGEESQKAYEIGGNSQKAAQEAHEVAIYRAFVPSQLDSSEILNLVSQAFMESHTLPEKKYKGAIIKLVKEKAQGRADGKLISDIVDEFIKQHNS